MAGFKVGSVLPVECVEFVLISVSMNHFKTHTHSFSLLKYIFQFSLIIKMSKATLLAMLGLLRGHLAKHGLTLNTWANVHSEI